MSENAPSFEELFSEDRLRRTSRTLRQEVRTVQARDVVDWLDWFVTLDDTLPLILQEILDGTYVPSPPSRFELAKSNGSFRVMTALNMKDAIVYRLICDEILERAIPRKVPGVFFSRRHSQTPVGKTLTIRDDPYLKFFAIWLRYHQYRTHTMLNEPYEILVVMDITNYFDSIQHSLLIEYLASYGIPRKALGLLGRLLEHLKPRSGHSASPSVGLPTDEFDCSRELAHVFLFEHDDRVVKLFGEDNFARWMDDQNVGARTLTEARRIIYRFTQSLREQRLTLNAGKTRFLTPEEVNVHFQLEPNRKLDYWDQRFKSVNEQNKLKAQAALIELWEAISTGPSVQKGYWSKVLKRVYAMAVKADIDVLESRALRDLIHFPELDERIFSYFSRRNRGSQLLDLFKSYCDSGENLYESTEATFFESLLWLDPSDKEGSEVLGFSERFTHGRIQGQTAKPMGLASAILVIYWLSIKNPHLDDLYSSHELRGLPKEVARAWLACSAAWNPANLTSLKGKLLGHPSDDVVRLANFLESLLHGAVHSLGNYKKQRHRWPLPGKYYDPRSWLVLDLASQGDNQQLHQTIAADYKVFSKHTSTDRSEPRDY